MSEHIGVVKAIYEAFGRGDIDALLVHCAPDIDWEHDRSATSTSLFRPRRGHDGVRGFFDELNVWEFLRFEPQTFLAGSNMVAVSILIEVRHRRTGKLLRDLESHWFSFGADGRVARLRQMIDTAQVNEIEAA
jgi:uncharacterized protein